jgi:hypothetical protein
VEKRLSHNRSSNVLLKALDFKSFRFHSMQFTFAVYNDYKDATSQNRFKARQASFQPENIQENPYGIICIVKKNGTRPLWARGDSSTELSFPFVVISPRGRQHLLGNAVDTSERPMWLIVPRAVGH